MLRWRLILGALLIAALVGLCWLDIDATIAGIWLMPIAIVATVLATKEVLDLLAVANMRPTPWAIYVTNLFLVLSPWKDVGNGLLPLQRPEIMLDLAAPALLLVFLVEITRYRKPGGNTANIAAGIFVLVYVGLMLRTAVSLRLGWGVGALVSWIVVVKMGDTGAYAVGRLIGRHKMAPLLSPGKTVEGAVGGLIFACLGAWLSTRYIVPLSVPESIPAGPWWGWIVFGLLVGAAGMVGDLAESLLKRDVGVKDSSTWLPGFGGVLDIIDSLLLSAPVAWFCWASGLVGR